MNGKIIKFIKNLGIKTQNLEIDYREKEEEENIFYLDNLGLEKLPKEIGEFKYLTVLRLDNNNLKELAKEFSKLKNLVSLDLSKNLLKELPTDIFILQKLIYINLENNPNLKLIHSQINWLKKLKQDGCDVQVDEKIANQIREQK